MSLSSCFARETPLPYLTVVSNVVFLCKLLLNYVSRCWKTRSRYPHARSPFPKAFEQRIHVSNDAPRKRSITIAGHRTSLSLEPVFWDLLKQEAARQNISIAKLVAGLDTARSGNLSSAVRVYLVNRLRESTRG